MRQSYDSKLIHDSHNKVVAVSFGAGGCAEHEWGIKELLEDFGVPEPSPQAIGLARRAATAVPGHMSWQEAGKYGSGIYCPKRPWRGDPPPKPDLSRYNASPLYTAWDASSFAVYSTDKKTIADLKKVFDALQRKDGAIWLGGSTLPFSYAVLVVGIASQLPDAVLRAWEEADTTAIKLKEATLATGIEAKLTAAGLRYSALSPAFAKDGSLIFWLNPCDQRTHQYGWVTLRDLEEWILGEGKCMKGGKR